MIRDLTGATADLGVLVPLAAALILVNGLDPSSVFIGAGLLVVASGLAFGIPFPVQPLKALTAVAVAQGVAPEVIHTAGFAIGIALLLLSVRGVAASLARFFTLPVVRALQFGVGVLLVVAAFRLVAAPPELFSATPASPWPLVLAVGVLGAVAWSAARGRFGIAGLLLGGGSVLSLLAGGVSLGPPQVHLPGLALPSGAVLGSALTLLVLPQLPLTFGNAVVAVTDVARKEFGPGAARVTPAAVCVSAGVGNVVAALIGGMPMCHGAGGLTAHVRLGARRATMNVILGGALLALGLLYSAQALALLGLLPVWALAGFLAYAGLRHASLVGDLSGRPLVIALVAGGLGAVLGNLAVTTVVALMAEHGRAVILKVRAATA